MPDAYTFLKSAVTAVPAMRYAMAVGGIIALLVIVKAWGIGPAYAGFGFLAFMVAMTIFVFFGYLASKATGSWIRWIVIVFAWFCLLTFMCSVTLSLASVFFDYPKPLDKLIGKSDGPSKILIVPWDKYWARAERLRGDYTESLNNPDMLEDVRKGGLALAQELELQTNGNLSRTGRFYGAYLIGVGYLYSALSSYAISAKSSIYGDYADRARQSLDGANKQLAEIETSIERFIKTGTTNVPASLEFRKWVNDYQAHDELRYAFGLSLLLRQRIGDPVLPQVAESFRKIPDVFLRRKSPQKESIIKWHCAQADAVKELCGRLS